MYNLSQNHWACDSVPQGRQVRNDDELDNKKITADLILQYNNKISQRSADAAIGCSHGVAN